MFNRDVMVLVIGVIDLFEMEGLMLGCLVVDKVNDLMFYNMKELCFVGISIWILFVFDLVW